MILRTRFIIITIAHFFYIIFLMGEECQPFYFIHANKIKNYKNLRGRTWSQIIKWRLNKEYYSLTICLHLSSRLTEARTIIGRSTTEVNIASDPKFSLERVSTVALASRKTWTKSAIKEERKSLILLKYIAQRPLS